MRPPPFSAASQAAVGAAMDRWDAVLETSDEIDVLRVELTEVVDLIDGFPAVRRALTDPSRSGEDKAQFATELLKSTFHPDIVDLVAGMSRSRMARTRRGAGSAESRYLRSISTPLAPCCSSSRAMASVSKRGSPTVQPKAAAISNSSRKCAA